MKRNICVMVTLLAFTVTTNICLKGNWRYGDFAFTLDNIEALASNSESGLGGSRIDCYNVIANADSGSFTVVKCSTCMDVKCSDYSNSEKCRK